MNTLRVWIVAALIAVSPRWVFAKVNEISVSDAELTVRKWLSAQNKGDFKAYERLYADRFTGIRRSGQRTVPMNRSRWMADRAKMFVKPMRVDIDELMVVPANTLTRVTFVQTWSSRTYKDKGHKQMFLIRDSSGGIKISQEEMLDSLIDEGKKTSDLDPLDYAIVLDGYVVLPGETAGLAKGDPKFVSINPSVAVTDVDNASLPEAAKTWLGKSVRIYGNGFQVCTGAIKKVVVLSAYIPHFGQVQRWEGKHPEEETHVKVPDEEIAKDIWQEGSKNLAGQLESKDCLEGTWAQSASIPERPILTGRSPAAELKKEILARFRETEGYRRVGQKSDIPVPANWDTSDEAEDDVRLFRTSKGTYVTVAAQAGNPCGSDYFAEASAIGFLGGTTATPTIQWLGSFDHYMKFVEAVEEDPAKDPAFRYESFPSKTGVLKSVNGTYQLLKEFEISYHDCPC